MSVITLTVVCGTVVFLLGLVSAIGSRFRKPKTAARVRIVVRESSPTLEYRDSPLSDALSMASAGVKNTGVRDLNRESEGAELATASGPTR